ncbi:MAG: GNAT family N-acetyltransferase [Timaviella obliquedivisa GSE-PSE-MK23-08B]|jgi:putative acetyltransferase|nr:GNAT family N-acetyltransferase [Timaviella obliquedivisa GSE-PSE-MK23-08B]
MLIRCFSSADIGQIVRLFYTTIHTVNCADFTLEQVTAWAPVIPNEVTWLSRYANRVVFVADDSEAIAGFAELEPNGHMDCFYCHHLYQRRGVGRQLYQRLEQEANSLELARFFVEVSITAQPFFEQLGFQTLHENQITRNNVVLTNFSMEKYLCK